MKVNGLVEKLTSRFFRRVDDAVWDMSTGQIGIKSQDSILTLIGKDEKDAQISENLFAAMAVPVPAFAQQLTLDQINFGDIVYGEKGALGWVIKKTAKSVTVMGKQGNTTNITPRKVTMLGGNGDTLMVLRSLITMTGGNEGFAGLQQSMLPMLMLMGDGAEDSGSDMLSTMLMMQFMGGQAQPGGAMNPMMMLMLMKGKDFF